jgi:1-piperideine-2-carboxylate/1-pyrroline-2-carboxylate reductase [NAD(P)H]
MAIRNTDEPARASGGVRPVRVDHRLRVMDAEETAAVLPYRPLMSAIAMAAGDMALGAMTAPERMVVPLGEASALLCMPAAAADIGIAKLITVNPGNPGRGLSTIQGEVIVFDAQTGQRLLLLDGPTLTARRTAAVTLLGVSALCRTAPRSAMLIGAGQQAAAHAQALIEVAGIRDFCIVGTGAERTQAFVERLAADHPGVRAYGADAARLSAEAIERADVVIALTTATHPVVPSTVHDRTLVVGVGAYRADMAEIPADVVRRRRIVVDYPSGARHEAGDLLQAGVDWAQVIDFADILAGRAAAPDAPTVFKTVGHASWDLAAARVAVAVLGAEPAVASPTAQAAAVAMGRI